ncbi:hypothetical protein ACFCWG_04090 [Streptomyces sp. NPDC056390]|uniref:hypothetical protein n=1 Tax=Streptomyces sp. NPDC056390 TaxID=3345806 RepID=UPI0035DB1D17
MSGGRRCCGRGRDRRERGLDKLTAKRVAQAVRVVPGLVDHHFKSAVELVAAAFSHAATADNDAVFEHAVRTDHPVDQVRQLMPA